MAALDSETINTIFAAGVVAAGYEIINEAEHIAREEYKIEEKWIDDFCISIRDLKGIVEKIKGNSNE